MIIGTKLIFVYTLATLIIFLAGMFVGARESEGEVENIAITIAVSIIVIILGFAIRGIVY